MDASVKNQIAELMEIKWKSPSHIHALDENHAGEKIEPYFLEYYWIFSMNGMHMRQTYASVVKSDKWCRGVVWIPPISYANNEFYEGLSKRYIELKDWKDPVTKALESINLFVHNPDHRYRVSLDGASFSLEIRTNAVSADLYTRNHGLGNLWEAATQSIKHFVLLYGNREMKRELRRLFERDIPEDDSSSEDIKPRDSSNDRYW